MCWQASQSSAVCFVHLCTPGRHASKPAVCCAEPGTGPEFHSALGMFIRKCCLTFWAMSFEVGPDKAYHLQRIPATVPSILQAMPVRWASHLPHICSKALCQGLGLKLTLDPGCWGAR